MSPTAFAAKFLLSVLWLGAATKSDRMAAHGICEAVDDDPTSCSRRGALSQLSTEQLLLQTRAVSKEVVGVVQKRSSGAKASSADDSCMASVRRRRRQASMHSCRRRHSSPGWADTDLPGENWKCDEARHQMVFHDNLEFVGYPCTDVRKERGLWCEVDIPPAHWTLHSCPHTPSTKVKVLTYNLFWWNLFTKHQGGERSAGRLIARTSQQEHYDFMAFQECDDRHRVLNDARTSGLSSEYSTIDGGRAIAIAYRNSRWTLLHSGSVDVGEDSRAQYYGKRSAMWARLQHKGNGKTVLFMNHHGPLRVSESGGCTGSSTALNILRVLGGVAHKEDRIILVGDFNSKRDSTRIRELEKHLTRVASGRSMGGVDHIFSNCGEHASGSILGKGDGPFKSDHDALSASFTI